MRGGDARTSSLFSYVDLEARVPKSHPLRVIRDVVNEALATLEKEFSALYSPLGRPSIPPEMLLRVMLLQAFYSVRSERQIMERLEFDMLFRWFIGLGIDDEVWNHSVFSKNRDRLLEGDIAAKFLNAVLTQPRVKRLLSTDHFSVDGTLIEAWASMKSFKPKAGADGPPPEGGGRNGEANFHGEKHTNETHASTTDPEARLYRKGPGKEAKLCFIGHALMENRNALFVDACLTQADGHAERIAALHMIEPRADRAKAIRLGADKAYDAEDFVNELRAMKVMPHVAQDTGGRASAIDARTTRHAGYAISQRIRKKIEEGFGRIKIVAGQEQTRLRGRARVASASPSQPPLTIWCVAQADSGADMKAPADCKLVGRWRIVEADIWERDYLDLCGPATIVIGADGRGENAFGAMQATLDIEYRPTSIDFQWFGFDEGDKVAGEGEAELLNGDAIKIDVNYHNGDDTVLTARR
jgi:transposase